METALLPTQARVLLASNSPRRRELLRLILPDFAIAHVRDIDESYPSDLAPEEVPAYISREKAHAYLPELVEDEIIITADTVVIRDGEILGKPRDHADAVDMLMSLMGKTHIVVTGVTLTSKKESVTFSERTEVSFIDISREEIEAYVSEYQPMDKAGAYGIQEWIGCVGINAIKGDFYNVMGLPLHALYHKLKRMKA